MSFYFAGFIIALVLAVMVTICIVYFMFVKERHKPEFYHYNISDLKHDEYVASEQDIKKNETNPVAAGVFIIPSRPKQKDDDYAKRPDYPESPVPDAKIGAEKLIDILNNSTKDSHEIHSEINSKAQYQSDV